jgi:hypothetical protein
MGRSTKESGMLSWCFLLVCSALAIDFVVGSRSHAFGSGRLD